MSGVPVPFLISHKREELAEHEDHGKFFLLLAPDIELDGVAFDDIPADVSGAPVVGDAGPCDIRDADFLSVRRGDIQECVV